MEAENGYIVLFSWYAAAIRFYSFGAVTGGVFNQIQVRHWEEEGGQEMAI